MLFLASVGESSPCGTISPYGTRPSLIIAWKPLHTPSTRPSRCFKRLFTASESLGFLKAASMNLPDPSGSSPAEKPPGNITICDLFIAFSKASTESLMPASSRLL